MNLLILRVKLSISFCHSLQCLSFFYYNFYLVNKSIEKKLILLCFTLETTYFLLVLMLSLSPWGRSLFIMSLSLSLSLSRCVEAPYFFLILLHFLSLSSLCLCISLITKFHNKTNFRKHFLLRCHL